MPWGIAETASEIEKIRAESSDMLGGLNSVGEIDYTTYSKLWDFYHDLLGKAYEQGLKDAPIEAEPVRHGKWIDIDSQMYTWKVRCDQCGHERSMMSTQGRYPRYCENCGAKMDERKEE